MKQTTITQDLEHVRNKFNFSEADMESVPQNPFTFLREIFKDTAFRASQYKILNKLNSNTIELPCTLLVIV